MEPHFSHTIIEKPIRTDADGVPVMPEWSDDDLRKQAEAQETTAAAPKVKKARKAPAPKPRKTTAPKVAAKVPRKRVAKDLQPDATRLDSVTRAKKWLEAHPEEAAMLRAAQTQTGDILADSGVATRFYSSGEAAAFFDKTVQWLYWGMRHPPHGGMLFLEPETDAEGHEIIDPDTGQTKMRDIPVPRLGDPITGKRRFDLPTIRKFATSAYLRGNIKEPKLRAVLERLVVAERGGNWKAIPIPKRQEDEDAEPE